MRKASKEEKISRLIEARGRVAIIALSGRCTQEDSDTLRVAVWAIEEVLKEVMEP